MDCPRCLGAMTLLHEGLFGDIPVHRCDACRALWTAPESLDRLDDNINVDASKLDWQPTGEAVAYRCPACPGGYRDDSPRLTALALAGAPTTVMHRCPGCDGLLLDDGTLDRIRAAVISA